MTNRKTITPRPSGGYDRIEWFDSAFRVRSVRAIDSATVVDVRPTHPTRRPGKWKDQIPCQGYYWCVGKGQHVRHESMMEFTSLMMFDHLFDIADVHWQPMLLTFAEGLHHTPDFCIDTAHGERVLLNVHAADMTTDVDERKFELTRQLCERVGWRHEVVDAVTDVTRWNLEMMARYNHPRYAPDDHLRARILRLVVTCGSFGQLREALATDRPGEHLPAVYHLMWNRAIRFAIERTFTDGSPIRIA